MGMLKINYKYINSSIITCLVFTNIFKYNLIMGQQNGVIKMWDLGNYSKISKFFINNLRIKNFSLNTKNNLLIIIGNEGRIQLLGLNYENRFRKILKLKTKVDHTSVAFGNGFNNFLTTDIRINKWDYLSGKHLKCSERF